MIEYDGKIMKENPQRHATKKHYEGKRASKHWCDNEYYAIDKVLFSVWSAPTKWHVPRKG